MLATLVAALTLAFVSIARADSIKMGDLWLDGVSIQKIENGMILYTSRAGQDEERDLTKVQGIKLTAHPELEAATKASAEKKDADAVAALQKVMATARQPWVKHYAQSQMIPALDRQGKLNETLEALLSLAKESKEDAYFLRAPIESAANATAAQRKEALAKLEPAVASTKGAAQAAVKRIIDILKEPAPDAAKPASNGTTGTPPANGNTGNTGSMGTTPTPTNTGATGTTPPRPRRGPAVTKFLSDTDPVSILLQDGKYQDALTEADKLLNTTSKDLSMRLYQKGLAQLGIADKSNDTKLYKDAGLTFARVVTYFGNRRSTYEGPALVELGYVHLKINRTDVAAKLFDRAINLVADDDAQVMERLEKLRSSIKPEEPAEGAAAP